MSTPAPVTRFVTGHNSDGRSIFTDEGPIPYTEIPEKSGRNALFGVPWQTKEFPTDISPSAQDGLVEGGPLHNESGTVCRIVEFPPQTSSPFHRTISLDYGILIRGEIHLELEDGATRQLKSGDVVVQRGTLHAWHNKTDEWARMVFVLIAAKPLVVNGKELKNEMHRD